MKGKILHYDNATHEGIIVADDFKRYSFKKDDVKNIVSVQKGMDAEFVVEGIFAKEIYLTESSSKGEEDMSLLYYEDQKYGFKELFCFKGCYTRWQYWRITIISFLIWMLYGLYISMVVLDGVEISDENLIIAAAIFMFVLLPLAYINIVTSIKRFHDINRSGWFYLITIIPYVGTFIVMLMNGLIPTKKENNRFCKRKK